jgi:hypothetical protein
VSGQVRRLQVHAIGAFAVVVLLFVAMFAAALLGCSSPYWLAFYPAVAGCLFVMLRSAAAVGRLREQESEARIRARERHRDVRRLSAPDAGEGQCPVCGYDDLAALAQRDAFLHETGSRRRVAEYGPRRAHQECAELVPYTPGAAEAAATEHERHFAGKVWIPRLGCLLCAKRSIERIAHGQEDVSSDPFAGVTSAELSRRLAAVFVVPPMILASDAPQVTRHVTAGHLSPDEARLRLRIPVPNEKGDRS